MVWSLELQKFTLNPTNVATCRPVYLFLFPSKKLEHAIPGQLSTDFQLNDLLDTNQSG